MPPDSRYPLIVCQPPPGSPWNGGFPASARAAGGNFPRAAGPVASALRARHQAMVTSCTIIIRISKALEKVTICPLTRTECAIYLVLHSKKLPYAARGGGWKPPFHGLTQRPSALLQTSHPLRPPNKPPAPSAPPPLCVRPVRSHHLCGDFFGDSKKIS